MAEQFCGTPFWDDALWAKEVYPDVSPCFQKVIFFIMPTVFLILISTCRLYHLHYSKKSAVPHNWLSSMKTIISLCLVVPALADMIRFVHDLKQDHPSYAVDYVTAIFRTLGMILSAVLVQLERKKAARPFMGLFTYWLILTFTGIFIFYSKIHIAVEKKHIDDVFRLVTFIIHYILVLSQLALSLVSNRPIQHKENASPELRANTASRLTYWWFNEFIIKGFKNPLQSSDLYELKEGDKANAWASLFGKCWTYETNRLLRSCVTRKRTSSTSPAPPVELKKISSNGDREQHKLSATSHDKESLLPTKLPPGKQPSMVKCLAKVFLPSILMCAAFKLVHDVFIFANPLLLKAIIQFVQDPAQPNWRGYVFGALMFLISIVQMITLAQYFERVMTIGMRLRATISSSVYNKAINLSSASRRESTVGEIVNLMSVDAQRFMDIMTYLNMLWSGPLQICVSMGLLWQILGPSVLVGMGVMGLLIPINLFIGNRMKRLQTAQMKEKDQRIKLMSEILNGIKVLKLYAWEESFSDIVNKIRKKELVLLRKAAFLNAFQSLIFQIAPFLVACGTFAVYVYSDEKNVLNAEKAFVSLSLFNIMRFPMVMLPSVISSLIQASVSVKRIAKFLSLEELNPHQIERSADKVNAISLENCSFTWKDSEDEAPTLTDLSIDIKHGELVAVVGVVGSGKSSLISALLGDMLKLSGHASVSGTIAYVPQQAWIQNATLRDNILFGQPFDKVWYNKVVDACALRPDLVMLPAADLTEIGEKGINLSGGQKQRVSLARAVYSRADIYYLDDPLSAVDSHVGKHIFDNVISHTGCLVGKTRVLVTHGISFLPRMDSILVLKQGQLSERGSFQQLLDHAGAFADFLKAFFLDEKEDLTEEDLKANASLIRQMSAVSDEDFGALMRERISSISSVGSYRRKNVRKEYRDDHSLKSTKSALSVHEVHPSIALDLLGESELAEDGIVLGSTTLYAEDDEQPTDGEKEKPAEDGEEANEKLIKAETSEQGRVKFAVVKSYLSAIGWLTTLLIVTFFLFDQVCGMISNIWLSKWSDDVGAFNSTKTRDAYLGLYSAFGIAQGLFNMVASFAMAMFGMRASATLHRQMLQTVLRCPQSFFDTTTFGEIINRFSSDIATLDFVMPFTVRSMINCVIGIISTIAIVGFVIPWFLAIIMVLAVPYVITQVCLTAPTLLLTTTF